MYTDTLIINYTTICERCVPFLLDTDMVCANLKQNAKLVCWVNFMVAMCINNIKHFIVQLMHTNHKILRLLK